MYGLPENIDLSFLIGKELTQICFGSYATRLNFDQNTSIYLQCEFYLSNPKSGEKVEADTCLLSWEKFPGLLGSKITRVVNKGGGELGISFSDGTDLLIVDSDKHYESYHITAPGGTIVV